MTGSLQYYYYIIIVIIIIIIIIIITLLILLYNHTTTTTTNNNNKAAGVLQYLKTSAVLTARLRGALLVIKPASSDDDVIDVGNVVLYQSVPNVTTSQRTTTPTVPHRHSTAQHSVAVPVSPVYVRHTKYEEI